MNLRIQKLTHRYGEHLALNQISLDIQEREIFGVLGPNGGGKSTLFHILSTLITPTDGTASIFGLDLRTQPAAVRKNIGVVFQNPSLDKKLTVKENLRHQGHLYGIHGERLRSRISDALSRMGLTDRADHLVDTLSGGLARRVEIAKCLLHAPPLLLLDEPSTGLDPAVRSELWNVLKDLQKEAGVTVVLTTHLMEEAEQCDRLAILDRGSLVALGTPSELRKKVQGDVIVLETENPKELAGDIKEKLGVEAVLVNGAVHIEMEEGHRLLSRIFETFPKRIQGVTMRKPTLEDVFLRETGHHLNEEVEA